MLSDTIAGDISALLSLEYCMGHVYAKVLFIWNSNLAGHLYFALVVPMESALTWVVNSLLERSSHHEDPKQY